MGAQSLLTVQRYLHAEGLLDDVSGRYDIATRRAIARWHYRHGYPISYRVSKMLRRAAQAAAKAAEAEQ